MGTLRALLDIRGMGRKDANPRKWFVCRRLRVSVGVIRGRNVLPYSQMKPLCIILQSLFLARYRCFPVHASPQPSTVGHSLGTFWALFLSGPVVRL